MLGKDTIIEIRCPASKVQLDLLTEVNSKKWYVIPKSNYIKIKINKTSTNVVYELEDVELNMKHPLGYNYYLQIQGMLHIMQKKKLYFNDLEPTDIFGLQY